MSDDPDAVPDGIEVIPVSPVVSRKSQSTESSEQKPLGTRVRHVESGEKPWWLDSSSNVPDGVQKLSTETSNSNSDSSESYEKVEIGVESLKQESHSSSGGGGRGLSRFPLEDEPLGDRASPEGVRFLFCQRRGVVVT